MSAQVWKDRLAYAARRVGWPGWLGVAGLLAALAFAALDLVPAQERLAGQGARLGAAQWRLSQQAGDKGAVPLSPTQQLAAFFDEFPLADEVPDILAQVYAIATEQQLGLELGEYAMTQVPGARMDSLRVTLPIKGAYPQVRKFMAQVLSDHAYVALESVSLRREKVGEDAVTGRIVFTLFLGHAS